MSRLQSCSQCQGTYEAANTPNLKTSVDLNNSSGTYVCNTPNRRILVDLGNQAGKNACPDNQSRIPIYPCCGQEANLPGPLPPHSCRERSGPSPEESRHEKVNVKTLIETQEKQQKPPAEPALEGWCQEHKCILSVCQEQHVASDQHPASDQQRGSEQHPVTDQHPAPCQHTPCQHTPYQHLEPGHHPESGQHAAPDQHPEPRQHPAPSYQTHSPCNLQPCGAGDWERPVGRCKVPQDEHDVAMALYEHPYTPYCLNTSPVPEACPPQPPLEGCSGKPPRHVHNTSPQYEKLVPVPPTRSATAPPPPLNHLTFKEKQLLMAAMRKASSNVDSANSLKERDTSQCGSLSRRDFQAVMDRLGILRVLSSREVDAVFKAFAIGGSEACIDYEKFISACQDLETKSSAF